MRYLQETAGHERRNRGSKHDPEDDRARSSNHCSDSDLVYLTVSG